ncbi:MAG: hypothetical protein ACSLE2_14435 [Lysobacterales bacterium]
MNQTTTKAPVHLWIVGILAVLWNAVGCFDYYATQSKLESYMSQFTPEQLEYFYAFPMWVDAAWAVAVWGSLLASIGLLLRKAWSVWLFGLAILAMAATSVYSFVLSDGMALMGSGAMYFTAVIWVIALFLFFYAQAMAKRRILL